MASVGLEHVSCSFRAKRAAVHALVDVSLDVADGEYVVLLGPSGCGKTTTLRLIAGLESPSEGTIRIAGQVANRVAPKDRDVAMVFQNYALYPHMTVYKNLAFGLKMRRTPKAEIQRRVADVARRLDITGLLERRPASLSGGEKQRVALGRAIVRDPRLFLFDEPLSHLDVSLRLRARTDLRALHGDLKATVLHVTHDQEEAMTLGDRIAVLRDGRLQQYGTPREIYRRPANRFVAGFVGTPPMNLIPGKLERNGAGTVFRTAFGAIDLSPEVAPRTASADHAEIVMGLRPQHATPVNGKASQGPIVNVPQCRVTRVEPLGEFTNVHAELGGGTAFVFRAASDFPGSCLCVDLGLQMSEVHWFSADAAGRRLNRARDELALSP